MSFFWWMVSNIQLFIGIVLFIVVAFGVIDYKLLGNPTANRVKSIIKSFLITTFFLGFGGYIFFFGAPGAIDHVRIVTSSVETIGTVIFSKPFREKRGTRQRRHWVAGFNITVELVDPHLGKITSIFENKTAMAQGMRVGMYHVPKTHLTSRNDKLDVWEVVFPLFGLGFFIMGIIRVWGFIKKKVA